MSKLETMKVSGNDYAKVAARLKDFREKHPRASVSTECAPYGEGGMMIRATILTDKSDEYSADATGSAAYTDKQMRIPKAFEKLETIAVGRALSFLGWLNNGEIASTEEMLEFEKEREEKRNKQLDEEHKKAVEVAVKKLESAKNIEALRQIFASLGTLMKDSVVVDCKDKMKEKLV